MTSAQTDTTHSWLGGRYRADGRLATGGQGVVHRARRVADDLPVAVKEILLTDVADAATRRRFDREVEALRRLDGHPNIVPLLDAVVDDDGRPHLVTPLYDSSLDARLHSQGRLVAAEVIEIGVDLTRALVAAHDRGILHCDLKPSNVFVDHGDERPRHLLGDFGAARLTGLRTITGAAALTLAYAAPETIEIGATDERSDLYGLGATLYALLSGRPPIDPAVDDVGDVAGIGAFVRRLEHEPHRPLDRRRVPGPLAELIDELLAKDPASRPPAAAVVLARLEAARLQPGVSARSRAPRRRLGRMVVAAATALAIATIGVASLAMRDDAPPRSAAATVADDTAVEIEALTPTTLIRLQGTRSDASPTAVPPVEEVAPGDPAIAPDVTPPPSTADVSTASASTVAPAVDPAPAAPSAPPTSTAAAPVPSSTPPTSAPTASVPTTELPGPCGPASTLWCDSFEAADASWADREQADIADLSVRDGTLVWQPAGDGGSGGSWWQRPVVLPADSPQLHVRWRMRVQPVAPDWFLNVLAIEDESDRRWNIDASADDGAARLAIYHQHDGSSDFGAAAPGTLDTAWACYELVLDRSDSPAATLSVDGAPVARLEQPPDGLGAAPSLRIGSGWTDGASTAPTVAFDDVAVGTAPHGC